MLNDNAFILERIRQFDGLLVEQLSPDIPVRSARRRRLMDVTTTLHDLADRPHSKPSSDLSSDTHFVRIGICTTGGQVANCRFDRRFGRGRH